jgi:hypothetical protein
MMHVMSSHKSRWKVDLAEDAVAAVILDEMDRQRYTRVELQQMTGINARTWINYFANRSRHIQTPTLVTVSDALGLTASEVLRRAEKRVAALDDSEAEILLGMSGGARMTALRRHFRGHSAKGTMGDGVEMRTG